MSLPKNNLAILLLAAGSSSRLGQSKQLLKVNGQPLLQRTVQAAMESGIENIFVVLGANGEEHKNVISQLPIHILQHQEWQKGMGSSLKFGLKSIIEKLPGTQAILVLVCDQPFLTSSHLKNMVQEFEKGNADIVASVYQKTKGVPALISKQLFEKLFALGDEQGARKIIESHTGTIQTIEFPKGEIDLDTPEDLENFVKSGN